MKCKSCDYFVPEYNFCKVKNMTFFSLDPECYFFTKHELENSMICFNCEHWIGGGDFGLSCRKNYYVASSNGFDVSCELFERVDR